MALAHRTIGAPWPQESASFFSEFFDRPTLAAWPLENGRSRLYMWKYKNWSTYMCDTWLERSWKEEQTLQKNICSKINFKGSKVEKRFFNFSFLMLPGHIKKSSACSRNAQWWQKTRQNVCRNVLYTIKTNREWNTTNWSVYGPLHSQSRIWQKLAFGCYGEHFLRIIHNHRLKYNILYMIINLNFF